MIVYEVEDDDAPTGACYFATLREARELARMVSGGMTIEIKRCTTVDPTKVGVVSMLNGEGWCRDTTVVECWEGTTCEDRGVRRTCPGCKDGYFECDRVIARRHEGE